MVRKKLVLNLDLLPEAVQQASATNPRKRTAGPYTGMGSSSGQRSRKRRNNDRNRESEDSDELEESESSILDDSTNSKIKREDGMAKKPSKPKRTMTQIVCIDNGMSGSGMSFAPSKTDPAVVGAEMDWPGGGKACKVPSQVALSSDNVGDDNFDSEVDSLFGFKIPKGATRRSYYKVSLDGEAGPSHFDDPIFNDQLSTKMIDSIDSNKNREAMVLALRHLRQIHHDKMVKQVSAESALNNIKFIYVMAYPAACSHKGKENLCSIAEEAGYLDREGDELKTISEAHAAAMAAFIGCRTQLGNLAWRDFFMKDSYVTILDIGALTDDLASIKITSNDPKLELKEATISTGARCGTTAIHCRFLKALEEKFGNAFTRIDGSNLARETPFFNDCEGILQIFDGEKLNRRHKIVLKLAEEVEHPDYDADAGEVFLHGHEIKKAIDDNLLYAKGLLQDQWNRVRNKVKQQVETTIFCGGGSLIPYVFDQLKIFCQANNVKAIRAKDPESTVCRGGVISKLDNDLLSLRLSRASFGIDVKRKGRRYIHWFLSQGDTIDTSKKVILKHLGGHVSLSWGEVFNDGGQFEIPIYTFAGGHQNPQKSSDAGVEIIATITIDATNFSRYLKTKLRKRVGEAGSTMTHIDVEVSLAVEEDGRLFFEARHGQASLGKGPLRLDSTASMSGA